MRTLEYQELKEEHIKDFFDKIFSDDDYSLLVKDYNRDYIFQGGYGLDGRKEIIEGDVVYYNYEDFKTLICKLDEYIIDEEEKFIVIV